MLLGLLKLQFGARKHQEHLQEVNLLRGVLESILQEDSSGFIPVPGLNMLADTLDDLMILLLIVDSLDFVGFSARSSFGL